MPRRILLEDQRLLDLQPAIAADRLDRGRAIGRGGRSSAWLQSLIDSTSRKPCFEPVHVFCGRHLGRRHQQEVG